MVGLFRLKQCAPQGMLKKNAAALQWESSQSQLWQKRNLMSGCGSQSADWPVRPSGDEQCCHEGVQRQRAGTPTLLHKPVVIAATTSLVRNSTKIKDRDPARKKVLIGSFLPYSPLILDKERDFTITLIIIINCTAFQLQYLSQLLQLSFLRQQTF